MFIVILYRWAISGRANLINVYSDSIITCNVQQGPFSDYMTFSAVIVPFRTIYLDAYISGRVDSIHREVGDLLSAGDKILTLSNPNVIMDIMQREAEVFEQSNYLRNSQLAMEQSRTNLQAQILETDYRLHNLTDDYHRKKGLFEKGMVANAEFKSTEYEYEYMLKKKDLMLLTQKQDSIFRAGQIKSLEDGLDRMEQNLGFYKKNIDQLVIRAPVSGVLTSFNAEIGEQISSGKKLGQIDDLSGYKLEIQTDEHWLNRIRAGLRGKVTINSKEYTISVSKIYPEVLNRTFTFEMCFDGEIPDDLRQGQSVYIEIVFDSTKDAILIKKGNFYSETGGSSVYVLSENGKYGTRRPITLGRQNSTQHEVLEGLTPGERIVISGINIWDKKTERIQIH